MNYFASMTSADRICLEGNEVTKIVPIRSGESGIVTHYSMSTLDLDKGAVLRKFKAEEIPHLVEGELLEIDRGYYSLSRQTDREINGANEMFGATKKKRRRAEFITFLCRRMAHYQMLGMPLTIEGVKARREIMDAEYRDYQARVLYGTDKANSTQLLKPLPTNWVLLDYYRKFRSGGKSSKVFIAPRSESVDLEHRAAMDFLFILRILYEYASPAPIAKYEVAEKAVCEANKENECRIAAGFPCLIDVKSTRTYERWIDKYLDPFTVVVEREGLAAARKKFGPVERGMRATFPGDAVQFDAWKAHVVTLDTTRTRYNAMTPEQRKKVKRVRRWVVVAIDVATRAILGFAFCRAPDQTASLEALRMCFADKTYLVEQAGLTNSTWHFRAPIHLVSTDSGSEFGKHPFGGALFGEAVRILTGSLMNTVAAVPQLRAQIERAFLTFDLRWVRHLPGWTAGKVHFRNDRNPYEEACMTEDELHRSFVLFIADYHTRPHRGLGGHTPAGMWEKLSRDPQFDISLLPSPGALREACGKYETAGVSEEGIRFKNLTYSNKFIRNQRSAKGVDRIAQPGDKLEIKVDHLDLGGITVLAKGDMISVACTDPGMRGKSLEWWANAQIVRKAEAKADAAAHAGANKEARQTWQGEAAVIAGSAGVNLKGRTPAEIEQLAREQRFGKGSQERPFVSEAEYVDPIHSGFDTGTRSVNEYESRIHRAEATSDDSHTQTDAANSLDRFRAKARRRLSQRNDEEERE